jgi:hypothetical protein
MEGVKDSGGLHHRIPAIYAFRETPVVGGLISYGGSLTEAPPTHSALQFLQALLARADEVIE